MIPLVDVGPSLSVPEGEPQSLKATTADFGQVLFKVQDVAHTPDGHACEAAHAMESVLQTLASLLQPLACTLSTETPVPGMTEPLGKAPLGATATSPDRQQGLATLLRLKTPAGEGLSQAGAPQRAAEYVTARALDLRPALLAATDTPGQAELEPVEESDAPPEAVPEATPPVAVPMPLAAVMAAQANLLQLASPPLSVAPVTIEQPPGTEPAAPALSAAADGAYEAGFSRSSTLAQTSPVEQLHPEVTAHVLGQAESSFLHYSVGLSPQEALASTAFLTQSQRQPQAGLEGHVPLNADPAAQSRLALSVSGSLSLHGADLQALSLVPPLPPQAQSPLRLDLPDLSPTTAEALPGEQQSADLRPQSRQETAAEPSLPVTAWLSEPQLLSGQHPISTPVTSGQPDTTAAAFAAGLDGSAVAPAWHVPGASNTVLLHIEPPEFGPLLVHVRLHDKRLSATFQTESPDVEAILRAHLPALHASLSQHGFEVQPLGLSLAPDGFNTAFSHGSGSFGQQQSTFHAFTQEQPGADLEQRHGEPESGRLFSEPRLYHRGLIDVVI